MNSQLSKGVYLKIFSVTTPLSTFLLKLKNAGNLEEALQCYVNYGEFPESGNLEDFWEAYSRAVSSLEEG